MKTKYLTNREALDLVAKTFKEVHDLVVPTMGAKGLMAVINQEWGQPIITDDGVTVAKSLKNFSGMKQMVLKSMIEAAHNTERQAYDGTTLTVQMVYEIFMHGYLRITKGEHPQIVASELEARMYEVINKLEPLEMKPSMVKDVATISTKIPEFGEIIQSAYEKAGEGMNIILQHAQGAKGIELEFSEGMILNSGYMTDALKDNGKEFSNARLALLKNGSGFNQTMIKAFVGTITDDAPIVFVVTPDFNPEAMRLLINVFVENNRQFQFVFLNEPRPEELYMDLAAISGAKIQDAAYGIKEYTYNMCGSVDKITFEKDRTIILSEGSVDDRVKYYKDKLESDKYKINETDKVLYTNRLGSLTGHLVKMNVGAPSLLEYSAIKLKLDDAIGAVKKAFESGVVIGGGKALYNLRYDFKDIADIICAPHVRILNNAGIKAVPNYRTTQFGIDVVTGKNCELIANGIVDSYASIKYSLINATSIACNYLKMYTLIKEEDE